MKVSSLVSAVAALSVLPLAAQLTVPVGNPVLDGKIDDKCYQNIPFQSGFTTIYKGRKPAADTRFKLCHNGNTLFIAIEAMESSPEKIKKDFHIADSANIWMNDSFEIFISPEKSKSYCYHIITDSIGQVRDAVCIDNNAGGYKIESIWKSGVQVKSVIGKDRWTAEIALPLGSMQIPVDPEFSFNIVRTRNAIRPAEVSSFAKNPSHRNLNPLIFVLLKLNDFNPSLYCVDIDCTANGLKKTEKGFQAEFTLHTASRSKKMNIITAEVSLLDRENKPVAYKRRRYEVEKGKFDTFNYKFTGVTPGSYMLDVKVTGSGSKKPLLASFRKYVTFEYTPIAVNLLYPKYRNTIFASMKDKSFKAQVEFKEFTGKPYTITVTNGNNEVMKIAEPAAPAVKEFSCDLAKAADGKYLVTVKCGSAAATTVISKVPALKGEVRVDENNITLVDGKPFFPFGWYGNDDAEGKKSHINSILDTALYVSPEQLNKAFDTRREMGVKMIIYPYQEFNKTGGWKIFSPKKRTGGITPEQRKYLMEFIPKIRTNPALLAYYLADEPENRDNNPRWYKEVAALLRELDPYHPCIMLNWGIPGIRRFYESADILLPDCYPTYFADGSTGKVRHCSAQWAEAATALRPSWFMPLVASWPARNRRGVKGVPPTYDDIRSQIFQALIHNVKGFNLYAYFESQRFASLMIAPDAVGKTLMLLKDILLQNSVSGAVKVKTIPAAEHFQCGFKSDGSESAVIAVNTQMKKVKAEFTLKKNVGSKLYVAGERRFVKVRNNIFSDTFAPGETHIYLTDPKLADAVPTVEVTRKMIDDLRIARKKKGNIIGMGEMLVADYIDYSAGKIPAGVPQITASSDPKMFFATANTGSRYYLIDGLTSPRRVEYTWSPDRKDKEPWIAIKLPRTAKLGVLKLYTPSGNLKSGKVVVNSKEFPFSNTAGSDEITIRLNGIEGNEVLLKIENFKRGSSHRIEGRLLTEIELYEGKKR